MNPATDINLALVALQAVLGLIASIRSQHGLADAVILAEAEKLTAGSDAAYAALVKLLAPASPKPTTVTTVVTK